MCCGSCLNCQRKAELAQHLGSEDGKMMGCLMMSVRSEADKTSCDKQLKQVSSVAFGMLHSESRMLKSPNLAKAWPMAEVECSNL
jgi:hypothetical protein